MTFAQRLHAHVIGMAEGEIPMPQLVQPQGWRSDGLLSTAETFPDQEEDNPEGDQAGWLDEEVM